MFKKLSIFTGIHRPVFLLFWPTVLVFTLSTNCFASHTNDVNTKSLYEYGLSVGGGYLPDYPGSNESHFRGLLFPFFIYRGTTVRSDEKGIRGRLVTTKHAEMSISFSGAFPTNSKDNQARKGMQDLNWMGQVGPNLIIQMPQLFKNDNFYLHLPIRAVLSTDLTRIDERGFVFNPKLSYEYEGFIWETATFYCDLSTHFATRKLMNYFYTIPSDFATPTRSIFDAKPGYLKSDLTIWIKKTFGHVIVIGAGVQFISLHGATNRKSPLFKSEMNTAFIMGLAWFIDHSEQTVFD